MLNSGMYVATSPTGPAGDALYAEDSSRTALPRWTSRRAFAPRARARTAAPRRCTPESSGSAAAPLAAGRYLVLVRSGSELRSRVGSPASAFADPLVFSGTDGARLLGLAGAPSGIAAAAWVTTGNRVHAAIYGDPDADTTDPRLTRLLGVTQALRGAAPIAHRHADPLAAERAGAREAARRPRAARVPARRALRRPAPARGPDPAVHAVHARRLVHPHP